MDVDGTLTDGMIYMGDSGEMFKAFNIKDGYGIKDILPKYGIIPVVITARESNILKKRCQELAISEIHQGCRDKLKKLKEIIKDYSAYEKYSLMNVAYVGDDILDIPCMEAIKGQGGFTAAPHDAVKQVSDFVDYISRYNAGYGAVRDIINYIVRGKKYSINVDVYKKRIDYALEYLKNIDIETLKTGTYNVNEYFYYMVQEYFTVCEENCSFELHRHYVDIQWMIEGAEIIKICDGNNLKKDGFYDSDRDVMFLENDIDFSTEIALRSGSHMIIPVGVAHKPCIQYEQSKKIKKLIGKIKVI